MCLAALALNYFDHYPFVCIANRDEFHQRPTAPMHWWPEGILAGKDLQSGGTWLGFSRTGQFALLTNVRDPAQQGNSNSPSRGLLVKGALLGVCPEVKQSKTYAGFNLISGNLITKEFKFFTNNQKASGLLENSLELNQLHLLSNGLLNERWPKTQALREQVELLDKGINDLDEIIQLLFEGLADQNIAKDISLPNTGVPLEWERMLAPIKIVSPVYGTRAQTVAIMDSHGVLSVMEYTLKPDGTLQSTVRYTIKLKIN